MLSIHQMTHVNPSNDTCQVPLAELSCRKTWRDTLEVNRSRDIMLTFCGWIPCHLLHHAHPCAPVAPPNTILLREKTTEAEKVFFLAIGEECYEFEQTRPDVASPTEDIGVVVISWYPTLDTQIYFVQPKGLHLYNHSYGNRRCYLKCCSLLTSPLCLSNGFPKRALNVLWIETRPNLFRKTIFAALPLHSHEWGRNINAELHLIPHGLLLLLLELVGHLEMTICAYSTRGRNMSPSKQRIYWCCSYY